MTKTVGNWNPIEPDVVSKVYAGVTLQTWLALLIINPNKAGVFSLFPYDIRGIVKKIRGVKTKQYDIAVASLRAQVLGGGTTPIHFSQRPLNKLTRGS